MLVVYLLLLEGEDCGSTRGGPATEGPAVGNAPDADLGDEIVEGLEVGDLRLLKAWKCLPEVLIVKNDFNLSLLEAALCSFLLFVCGVPGRLLLKPLGASRSASVIDFLETPMDTWGERGAGERERERETGERRKKKKIDFDQN